MELNKMQMEAVRHSKGPSLILAGAGSGKTTVLSHRTRQLILLDVDPSAIMCVTFTNRAAESLKKKIVDLAGEEGERVWVSTFHGLGLEILRDLLPYDFSVASTGTSRQIVKEIIQSINLEGKDEAKEFLEPKAIYELIALFKSEFVYPSFLENGQYMKEYIDVAKVKSIIKEKVVTKQNLDAFRYVYKKYQQQLLDRRKVDVDDILMESVRMFIEDEQALNKYQTRFEYLMIDEYQDTNRVQYLLVKLMAAKERNLTVVGDDFQSIYAFRGSDIRNILEFLNDYPDAFEIKLEENYRSTKTIVQAANEVIAKNKEQKPKTLYTSNKEGEKIRYIEAEFNLDEAEKIAQTIKELVAKGKTYKDIAIFYRHHADSSVFESVFVKERIPFVMSNESSFFERKEIKDLLFYLQFLQNPHDVFAFSQVINHPKRGIGATTVQKIIELSKGSCLMDVVGNPSGIDRLNAKTKEGLKEFQHLFNRYQDKISIESASVIIEDLVKDINYEATFEQLDDFRKKEKKEHIKKLIQLAHEFENRKGDTLFVSEFVEELHQTDVDALLVEDEFDRVNLLTIHASKGLEFPVVFLTGMKEQGFPSKYATTPKGIEEERRLCYVAFTRAQDELYITYPRKYVEKIDKDTKEERDNTRSRFLDEFDWNLVEKR